MKFSNIFLFLALLIPVAFFSACNDDEQPVCCDDEELITTLTYTLTPDGGGDVVTFNFQDTDGDGGNDPVITNGTLIANTTYAGSITVSNESVDPVEDITAEVAEEDLDHQFFFSSTTSGLTIEYNDLDSNGNPIGLSTTLNTGDAGSGNMTITLRHEPEKTASGVSDGNIDNAGGETDIEVTFSVTVQ